MATWDKVRKKSWSQGRVHNSNSQWWNLWGTIRRVKRSGVPTNAGFFKGAHDFDIDHPTMIETQINLSPSTGTPSIAFLLGPTPNIQIDILDILTDKRMFGVEVDSGDRDPPPRCHPETRKNVRDRAKVWLRDPKRRSRLRYLWGPAGEGKSAIAQSVAEEAKDEGHLGASIFFSKLNDQDDLDRVIPTIVCQLATIHPEFASLVSSVLEADRTILEKNRTTQFRDLLIDPFREIMKRNPSAAQEPLLIILDGIDECKDQRAQAEFIELIEDHVRAVPRFPLLWIISSRQQAHLKPLLFKLHCECEVLKLDDEESRRDVECVLRDGFSKIREKYQANFDTDWPPECDLQRIIEVSSGFFAFGSSIIDFVGDSQVNNPENQLETCMKFLDRRGHVSPLQALDLLYHQIMSEIPPGSLPITLRILGMSILYPRDPLLAQAQANFLGLDRHKFIQSFRGLHSVLDMPSAQDAHESSIHFLHTSFADFLKDPERSRNFCIKPVQVHFDVALRALQWHTRGKSLAQKDLKWIFSEVPAEIKHERRIMLKGLREYSSKIALMACSNVPKEEAARLLDELENFNFRALDSVPEGFLRFIPWLYSLGQRGQALVHVASLECPAGHSAKKLSAQRPLDRQSKKLYSKSFGSNLFNGHPPYGIVFHLGKDQKRSQKKERKKVGKKGEEKDEENDRKRKAGDDGNACAFALTLTRDPRSALRGAAWVAGKLRRNEVKRRANSA